MWGATLPRGLCGLTIASSGLALGDAAIVTDALRDYGRPKNGLEQNYRLALVAMAAIATGDARASLVALGSLRERAERDELPLFTALATWGLAVLDPSDVASRRRYEAFASASGIVNPDRYCWSLFPVGPHPGARRDRAPHGTGADASQRSTFDDP